MKIWKSFGTEHSYSLVMIGSFKEEHEAEKMKETIELLEQELSAIGVESQPKDRYSEEVIKILQEANNTSIAPYELEQFVYDRSMIVKGNKLSFSTDEIDISAYIKLMIHAGAKVEVFEHRPSE